MNAEALRSQYEDRHRRYGAIVSRRVRIELSVDPNGIVAYGAQVATLVAASLLGRLFDDVHLSIPEVELHEHLRTRGHTLRELAQNEIIRARPRDLRATQMAAGVQVIRVHCGKGSGDITFIGSKWNATVSAAEIGGEWDDNPFGAAMAAIVACGEVFRKAINPNHVIRETRMNVWRWSNDYSDGPEWRNGLDLGEVWTIGLGSVGSAAMYFLPMVGLQFQAVLVDKDEVKIENVSRSPLFTATEGEGIETNVGMDKAQVVSDYLESCGLAVKEWRKAWLHEVDSLWRCRNSGTPDLLISTANDHHVRWLIESLLPPVQIHASTGMNWQVTAFRHIPLKDACSLCVFPDSGVSAPTTCATGEVGRLADEEKVDASLPFLSYAAGLMIAIDAWKLASGETFSQSERRYLQISGEQLLDRVPLQHRPGCTCQTRDARAHRSALAGGRFALLSD